LNSDNYTWDFVLGAFMITKATQQITLTAPSEVELSAGTLPIIVSSTSGLQPKLSVAGSTVATLSGTTLNLFGTGAITVTAIQEGNNNYEAAEPVTATIIVVDNHSDLSLHVHQAL